MWVDSTFSYNLSGISTACFSVTASILHWRWFEAYRIESHCQIHRPLQRSTRNTLSKVVGLAIESRYCWECCFQCSLWITVYLLQRHGIWNLEMKFYLDGKRLKKKMFTLQEELRQGNVKNQEILIKQLSEFLGTNDWILGDQV